MARSPEERASVADVDCTDTTALVTGSTSGIGRAAALALGRLGADVIVHGRDREAGEAVIADIEDAGAEAQFIAADFADVSAVRNLATSVRAETDELDLLLNNAGGLFRRSGTTTLGVEVTFHVNHLSPYLLTAELLDHLGPGARVVTTASAAHRGSSLDLDRATESGGFSGFSAYGHSKLANVLFASELARRLEAADRKLTSNSVHPGAIPGTGFSRFLPGPLPRLVEATGALPWATDVEDGAAELLFVALSERTADISGRYFTNQQPTQPSQAARDREAARRLWERSAELLGIEDPLPVDGPETAETGV